MGKAVGVMTLKSNEPLESEPFSVNFYHLSLSVVHGMFTYCSSSMPSILHVYEIFFFLNSRLLLAHIDTFKNHPFLPKTVRLGVS